MALAATSPSVLTLNDFLTAYAKTDPCCSEHFVIDTIVNLLPDVAVVHVESVAQWLVVQHENCPSSSYATATRAAMDIAEAKIGTWLFEAGVKADGKEFDGYELMIYGESD